MIERIDLEHPEYQAQKQMWRTYRDLYAGGETMRANAYQYLQRRSKEPLDVYYERLQQAFYENYVGSIVDWFAATLFRREPLLSFDGGSELGKRFFGRFADDCDLRGSSLTAFMRRVMTAALVQGKSYVLVDFPYANSAAMTRAEEEASGASRAYLVHYSADEVINWGHDELGNLEWVVLRSDVWAEQGSEVRKEKIWSYFDKQVFRKYREMSTGPGRSQKVLVAEGAHGLSRMNRVPLFELKIMDGLWLLNKAASLQLEHFNKSNALSWALQVGLFAMPVIYSEKAFDQVVGEGYYLQLGKEDKFSWTEPQGNVYGIAVQNLERLKEEIYRVCFLISQAASPAQSQVSGLSKQRDYAVTQEVLRTYGDLTKDLVRTVLQAIADVREDGLMVDAAGLDEFDIGDFRTELDDAKQLLEMGIPSATLKQQVFKRLAQKYLSDVKQEVKNQIISEIEEGLPEQAA